MGCYCKPTKENFFRRTASAIGIPVGSDSDPGAFGSFDNTTKRPDYIEWLASCYGLLRSRPVNGGNSCNPSIFIFNRRVRAAVECHPHGYRESPIFTLNPCRDRLDPETHSPNPPKPSSRCNGTNVPTCCSPCQFSFSSRLPWTAVGCTGDQQDE